MRPTRTNRPGPTRMRRPDDPRCRTRHGHGTSGGGSACPTRTVSQRRRPVSAHRSAMTPPSWPWPRRCSTGPAPFTGGCWRSRAERRNGSEGDSGDHPSSFRVARLALPAGVVMRVPTMRRYGAEAPGYPADRPTTFPEDKSVRTDESLTKGKTRTFGIESRKAIAIVFWISRFCFWTRSSSCIPSTAPPCGSLGHWSCC